MTQQINLSPTQAQSGIENAMGKLAALLQMEERLRQAEKKELPFIIVNETRLLIPYRQAALWRANSFNSTSLMAVSGLAVTDANSPYIQWLSSVCQHIGKLVATSENKYAPLPFTAENLPPELQEDWNNWLPAMALFIPLPLLPLKKHSSKTADLFFGGLVIFNQQAFSQADLRTAQHLSGAYAQGLCLFFKPKLKKQFHLAKNIKYIITAVLLVALLPLKQTVLAPAEIIAKTPWPVRAPLEGVVERILVVPNANLKQGEPLLKLDTTELETRLAVAAKSLGIARAELRQAQQQAFNEREAKLRLAYLNGRLEQLEAEKSYVEELLVRAIPQSPINGVALIDAPEEWAGKPVSLGQRIMTVADPKDMRLEVFLPADDYIVQNIGDEISFFSNTNPGSPVEAKIIQIAFQAQETQQAGLGFRLRADFNSIENENLRLGLRGSAKLYGQRAPLIYHLLRKPLTKLRQWVGI